MSKKPVVLEPCPHHSCLSILLDDYVLTVKCSVKTFDSSNEILVALQERASPKWLPARAHDRTEQLLIGSLGNDRVYACAALPAPDGKFGHLHLHTRSDPSKKLTKNMLYNGVGEGFFEGVQFKPEVCDIRLSECNPFFPPSSQSLSLTASTLHPRWVHLLSLQEDQQRQLDQAAVERRQAVSYQPHLASSSEDTRDAGISEPKAKRHFHARISSEFRVVGPVIGEQGQ